MEKIFYLQKRLSLLLDSLHINRELTERILKKCQIVQVDKKQAILSIGDVSSSLYLVISGSVRIYSIDSVGNQVTSWLLFENDIALSAYSFFNQKPSSDAMETIEKSTLLRLDYIQLQSLYQECPEFNTIGRMLTEQYLIRSEIKAHSLRTLSARERYIELLNKHPQQILRVPLGYIASYLGICQATLSRIRASL